MTCRLFRQPIVHAVDAGVHVRVVRDGRAGVVGPAVHRARARAAGRAGHRRQVLTNGFPTHTFTLCSEREPTQGLGYVDNTVTSL